MDEGVDGFWTGGRWWLSIVLLGAALLWLRQEKKRLERLPPGPFSLPWIGYLPWIDSSAPYETFAALSRRYGRIYSLKLGNMLAVFISDPQLVRQAFSRPVMSGRAPLYLTHGIMKGHGLICAEGESWREHRRFVMNVMKQLGMAGRRGASLMESRVMDRVLEFIQVLKCQVTTRTDESDDVAGVDLVPGLRHCIGNIINGIVFGRTYAADDPTWIWLQHLLDQGVKQVAVAGPMNFLPLLRFLPSYRNMLSFILDGQAETHRHYQEIIDQCHLSDNQDDGNYTTVMEAYLLEMRRRDRKGEPRGTFTIHQLYHVLADMFGAGTDTALTTIKWIVLYMILYPDVQSRIQEEIDRVLVESELHQGRIPCYATDAERMPWTVAAICEVQRIKTILPLGVPHGTLDDCELDGYRIPKGAMVVPVWWAMNLDPTLWPEPLEFRPERFLVPIENDENEEQDGDNEIIKWKWVKPDHFMPFQSGRRMCLGDDLGRTLIFLFTVTLLQHFRISFPPNFKDYQNHSTRFPQPEYGFTLVPHPFPVALYPRSFEKKN